MAPRKLQITYLWASCGDRELVCSSLLNFPKDIKVECSNLIKYNNFLISQWLRITSTFLSKNKLETCFKANTLCFMRALVKRQLILETINLFGALMDYKPAVNVLYKFRPSPYRHVMWVHRIYVFRYCRDLVNESFLYCLPFMLKIDARITKRII